MEELIFVYGTLRDPKIQMDIIGRLIEGTPDTLLGYEKSTIKLRNIVYPILVPGNNGVIEGEILKVSQEELNKIDEYETDAYRRVKVKLKSGTDAWVYMK
ncbi:MAG TPA: gamma-glutamylcyclotransferase family protein [Patescibacteria group bacterium]|nr:gamma-glutamylcyclotransferase family protein [Patescibacteria group bacterium]